MSILYVIFLNVMFVSYVRSDLLPGVVCVRLGTNNNIEHSAKADVSQIPDRCKVVIIGEEYFDEEPSREDDDAMAALKEAGKTVYMIYQFPGDRDLVKTISDQTIFDEFIEPMLRYLKAKNIEGVILGYLNIYERKISDYASLINTLISKIKIQVPSIKIGLHLNGTDSHLFSNIQAFDFELTNTTVDFYVVDLWKVGPDCIEDMNQNGGRQPITSNNSTVLTLEKIIKNISDSLLDKSKLVANIYDLATLQNSRIHSYTDYCSHTIQGVWCVDTSQILYEKVKYLKNNIFKGLMIQFLDFDDMTNTCECGNFPVANTFIDAWEDNPLSSCLTLN